MCNIVHLLRSHLLRTRAQIVQSRHDQAFQNLHYRSSSSRKARKPLLSPVQAAPVRASPCLKMPATYRPIYVVATKPLVEVMRVTTVRAVPKMEGLEAAAERRNI
jgi:hypothetical protein